MSKSCDFCDNEALGRFMKKYDDDYHMYCEDCLGIQDQSFDDEDERRDHAIRMDDWRKEPK